MVPTYVQFLFECNFLVLDTYYIRYLLFISFTFLYNVRFGSSENKTQVGTIK